MGAPKQKWTAEEEAALKAGVVKHGAGKWRTILKDTEFSDVLYLRSNVDLKDKWRNMSVMANGWGSREKASLALKKTPQTSKQEENPLALSVVNHSDEDSVDVKPLVVSNSPPLQISTPKRSTIRLDNLVMEAVNNLKEPGGSNKTAIGAYIEDQYWSPPNFKRVLSGRLKFLTAKGKLIKVKRRYRFPPAPTFYDKRENPTVPLLEGRNRENPTVPLLRYRFPPKVDFYDTDLPTRAEIDTKLFKMRTMTATEAAAVAARAVAEAEAAIADAEEAARDAEQAEADAEAAIAFAEAAKKTHKGRNLPRMVFRC